MIGVASERGWSGQALTAFLAAAFFLTAAPTVSAEHANSDKPDSDDSAIEFDFDSPPKTRFHLTPDLSFGTKIKGDFEFEDNFDLDKKEDDALATLQPDIEFALSYNPSSLFNFYMNFGLDKEFEVKSPDGRKERDVQLDLGEVNMTFRDLVEAISLTIGRQNFEDEREWIYDEDLDGARLFFRNPDFGLEASVTSSEVFEKYVLDDDNTDEIFNFFLYTHHPVGKDSKVNLYLLFLDDQSGDDEDLVFVGLSSHGELNSDLEYWAEVASVRGTEDSKDILGFGVDVGATYVFDLPLEPSVTVGAAFGTGDHDPDDSIDRSFRQTGLQDNTDKFNGVTSFKYYGELFDPELSNMLVLTGGLGIRPTRKSSIDLIYHYYRQHHASDELRDVGIDEDPEGRDAALGHELDLVFGLREIEDVHAEAVISVFVPGGAFPSDADLAYLASLQVEFRL